MGLESLFSLTAEGWLSLIVMLAAAGWMGVVLWQGNLTLQREQTTLSRLRELLRGFDPEEEGQLQWEDLEATLASGTKTTVFKAADVVRQSIRFPQGLEASLAPVFRRSFVPGQVRLLPNLFMLLGLLGTVAGLAGTLGSLAPQVQRAAQAASPDQLAQDLGFTIGAMQGAFGASLWGILLAVASSVVLGFWNARQGKFTGELEDVVLSQLAPALMPPSVQEALETQVRALKSSGQAVKDFQNSFSETLERFEQDVKSATTSLSGNVQELKDLTESLRGQLAASIAQLGQAGLELAETGKRLVGSQDVFARQFEGATLEMSRMLGGQVSQMADLQAVVASSTQKSLEGVALVSDRLDGTTRVLRDEGLRQQQDGQKVLALLDSRLERLEKILIQMQGGRR